MKLSISKEAAPPSRLTDEERALAEESIAKGPALGAAGMGTGTGTGTGTPTGTGTGTIERADEAARTIRESFLGFAPKIAVVLGSGLGAFADALEGVRFLDYAAIPHFPRSTVVGHRGRLAGGTCSRVPILAMQGRFHYYEGYSLDEVTFPVRVLARLGVRLLVLSNAAGGISEKVQPGDLMTIDDHLNLMGVNPLRGPPDERLGPRFPDMSEVYPPRFRQALFSSAPTGAAPKHGVYAALPGPSYETPAEIRVLAKLGADAVGMSTVPEAIVAAQMGLPVLGISGIANMAAGLVAGHRLTHAEVMDMMRRIAGTFHALLCAAMPAIEGAI